MTPLFLSKDAEVRILYNLPRNCPMVFWVSTKIWGHRLWFWLNLAKSGKIRLSHDFIKIYVGDPIIVIDIELQCHNEALYQLWENSDHRIFQNNQILPDFARFNQNLIGWPHILMIDIDSQYYWKAPCQILENSDHSILR